MKTAAKKRIEYSALLVGALLLIWLLSLFTGCATGVQLYEVGKVKKGDFVVNAPIRVASFNSNIQADEVNYTSPGGARLVIKGKNGIFIDNMSIIREWMNGAAMIVDKSTGGAVKVGLASALPGIAGAGFAAIPK